MSHVRNLEGLQGCPRCGAKTRAGTPCKSPAVRGKARCRMHGGGAGSGGQPGNQNALKHGIYTADAKAFNRQIQKLLRDGREFLE